MEHDRFCGDCGFDTRTPTNKEEMPGPVTSPEQSGPAKPPHQPGAGQTSISAAKNSRALTMMIGILVLIFAGGGGLYWWLSGGEGPAVTALAGKEAGQRDDAGTGAPAPDLSRAVTYLPEPSLKCSFYVYYPDGTAGDMERVTARVVPSETVRVSEVELNEESGETYGFAFHYVERADGIYYIYDDIPTEIYPVLKNNLSVGQTWNYQDEFGTVVWEVADMGVSLDLGFVTLDNCLLLAEDNQAMGLKTITYYAPGMGRVMVRSSLEGADYIKLTGFSSLEDQQAADIVKKWAVNYAVIHDDRTQS